MLRAHVGTTKGSAIVRTLDRGDGFVARSAATADFPAILNVLQASFDQWPPVPTDRSALDFLKWKSMPVGVGPEAHGVVEFEGDFIACKLRWFGRAWLCGVEHVTDVGADQAVLAAFQGRGIARLANDLEDRGDRLQGTVMFERPSQQAAVRHMEIAHTVHELRTWIRPLHLRSQLSVHLRDGSPLQRIRAIGSIAAHLISRPLGGGDSRYRRLVEPVERLDERVNALWLAARDHLDFARVHDAEYLNWRYADPRGGRCLMLGQFEDGELRAYAVFRHVGRELNLLDLLAHPDDPAAATAVLERGVELGRELGVALLVAWLVPGHRDEAAYAAAGFVPRDAFPVDYKVPRGVAAPEVAAQLNRNDLRRHVTMGDFDFA